METLVEVVPRTKWAKERVQRHGAVMREIRREPFRGEKAVLLESLKDTSRGSKWMGWFTEHDAVIQPISQATTQTPK